MLDGEMSLPSKVDMLYASIGSLRHDIERFMISIDIELDTLLTHPMLTR